MSTLNTQKTKNIVFLIILVIVIFVIGGLYLAYLLACEDDWCYHYEWQKERRADIYGFDSPSMTDGVNNVGEVGHNPIVEKLNRPVLFGLGINIEAYNSGTKKAGDLVFTKDLLFDDG